MCHSARECKSGGRKSKNFVERSPSPFELLQRSFFSCTARPFFVLSHTMDPPVSFSGFLWPVILMLLYEAMDCRASKVVGSASLKLRSESIRMFDSTLSIGVHSVNFCGDINQP